MRVRWISRSADVPSEKRRPPIASISSMKIMHGWWSRAYANIWAGYREGWVVGKGPGVAGGQTARRCAGGRVQRRARHPVPAHAPTHPRPPSHTRHPLNSVLASRIRRADSPMYLSTMADDTTFKKLASMFAATARASRVLPVPGGPYSSTPLGGLMPTRWKSSGLSSGSSIDSRSSRIWRRVGPGMGGVSGRQACPGLRPGARAGGQGWRAAPSPPAPS